MIKSSEKTSFLPVRKPKSGQSGDQKQIISKVAHIANIFTFKDACTLKWIIFTSNACQIWMFEFWHMFLLITMRAQCAVILIRAYEPLLVNCICLFWQHNGIWGVETSPPEISITIKGMAMKLLRYVGNYKEAQN